MSILRRVLVSLVLCSLLGISASFAQQGQALQFGYVAFSLGQAKARILADPASIDNQQIQFLGGITSIRGVVADRASGDLIIVGESLPDREPISLDDLAVALRSRFVHREWPAVSIDPTELTAKSGLQDVRFEGGIGQTRYGHDLLGADFLLKEMSLGLREEATLETYWTQVRRDSCLDHGSSSVLSRFWFYPLHPSVAVRENVVVINNAQVGVFTEVLSATVDGAAIPDLNNYNAPLHSEFANQVTEQFDELATKYDVLQRLKGLNELVALTRALEELDAELDLSYWLQDYPIATVEIDSTITQLERNLEWRTGREICKLEMEGGVQLAAVALRLNAGDVSALRDAVLHTRPEAQTLSWSFIVGEDWVLATSGTVESSQVGALISHAQFLFRQRRYEESIRLYDDIVRNVGAQTYETCVGKSVVLRSWGAANLADDGDALILEAIEMLEDCIEIQPRSPDAHYELGTTLYALGQVDEAVGRYEYSLEIDPNYAISNFALGRAHYRLDNHDLAIAFLNRYIEFAAEGDWVDEARGLVARIQSDLESDPDIRLVSYVIPTHGIEFDYSSRWSAMSPQEVRAQVPDFTVSPGAVAFLINEQDVDENVNIQVTNVGEDPPSEAQWRELIGPMSQAIVRGSRNPSTIISADVIEISDVYGIEIVTSTRRLGAALRQRQLSFVKNRKLITFTLTAPETRFDLASRRLGTLVASIEVR